MKRRARTVLLVSSACLAAGCLALFLWLPWNPFEADAGPLDEWIPADVDAVVRFDAGEVRRSDVVRTLWSGPAGRRLRDEFDLDARLDDVRRVDDELAALPLAGADPPTIEGDLAGGEVLVALRGDDVLAMSRISGRAKAVDLIRRAGDARRKAWRVRIDGESYAVAIGGGREIRFARRRDVLFVSTSKDFLDAALASADGHGGFVTRERVGGAAGDGRPTRPRGASVGAWARGPFAARWIGEPPIGASALRPTFERPISLVVDVDSPHVLRLRATSAGGDERDVSELASAARRYAVAGRSIADGALPISAREAVETLFESQPAARRKLVEGLLSERGTSTRTVVEDLARHLSDGAGFVVARLPEADALRLDDPDGDPVEPIPATLVVFRLADADSIGFVAALQRHAEALFGRKARLRDEPGPGGARLYRASMSSLGPEWALLRPTFAIVGDHVVFCTNDDYLERALSGAPARVEGPVVAALRLDVSGLKTLLLDQRWNVADRNTRHDWAAERRAFGKVLAVQLAAESPQERRRMEDEEIAQRIRRRKVDEFPVALADYADSLRWLDSFGRVEGRVVRDSGRLRLDVEIDVRDR